MEIIYSNHWIRKHSRKRKDITNDMIEFALKNSKEFKDEYGKMRLTQSQEFYHQEER